MILKLIARILALISLSFSQYYELNINLTGQSHLIILQESIQNLENGWEIGIFDQQAIINDGNCDTEYGDLLVASGIWVENQLEFSAIGSIDFCNVGGEQRAGFMEDNEIFIRVFDTENQIEYSTSYYTMNGVDPIFTFLPTVISEISLDEILYENTTFNNLEINEFSISKLYPNPANPMIHISFEMNLNQSISFSILGINGKSYFDVLNSQYTIGINTFSININDFPSGIYFFFMTNGIQFKNQKFIVLK